MERKRVFRAIPELCTGCLMCELMCSLSQEGTLNPYLARLRITRPKDDYGWTPVICRHCRVPKCQEACPIPEAMVRDEGTGVVRIDPAACINCLACVEACPFGAIQVGPQNQILKCDLCSGDPACVRFCPPRPENSLPHLPWPKQSCLQYVEPHQVNLHKFASTLARGKGVVLPRAEMAKRYELNPQLAREAAKYEKGEEKK